MNPTSPAIHRFCVAPMMEYTDRHFRYLCRLLSRHVFLFTEMVTAPAVQFGNREKILGFDPSEKPLALQLGGSDPVALAECAKIGEDFGYDEINLNVGCPSDRVQQGRFGACLMLEPELVARCVERIRSYTSLPVSVKTRLGVDHHDSFEFVKEFIEIVSQSGCETFFIHARKAWLKGLSPKQNREKPPLQYSKVHAVKAAFPHLEIILNGGIQDHQTVSQALQQVDGVMVGRQIVSEPWFLSEVDALYFQQDGTQKTRHQIALEYAEYIETKLSKGYKLNHMTKHLVHLFHGCPGARNWRRTICEESRNPRAGIEVIQRALAA